MIKNNANLQGNTLHMRMTGQPCDISHLCDFEWYEWRTYRSDGRSFPLPSERLGKVLDPATHAGKVMSQWILTSTGDVLPFQTLRQLTPAEMMSPTERDKRKEFDTYITKHFGDSINPPPPEPEKHAYYEDDVEG